MKFILVSLCSTFLLIGCNSNVVYTGNDGLRAEVIRFSKHVQKVISLGQTDHFLKHVKPDYLQEQLVTNLKGDTTQFINEFFCGKLSNKYTCMPFQTIMKMQLLEINGDKNNVFKVKYHIENEERNCMVSEVFIQKKNDKYYIFSAVG